MPLQDALGKQLDEVIFQFDTLRQQSRLNDLSDLRHEPVEFIAAARAAIHRVAGRPSTYVDQCEEIVKLNAENGSKAKYLRGVVRALNTDLKRGYLQSQRELIHAEVFSDFLETGV